MKSTSDTEAPLSCERNLMKNGFNLLEHDRYSKSAYNSPISVPKLQLYSLKNADKSADASLRVSPRLTHEYQSVTKDYNTVKRYFTQVGVIDGQLNHLYTEMKRMLAIKDSDIPIAIKSILERVKELLEGEELFADEPIDVSFSGDPKESFQPIENGDMIATLNKQIGNNFKELMTLKAHNDELRNKIKSQSEDLEVKSLREQLIEKNKEVEILKAGIEEHRALMKESSDGRLTRRMEHEDLLRGHGFIFQKDSLASLMRGLQLKQKEMASVDKVQIDYKQKRVIVEYNIGDLDLKGHKYASESDMDAKYNHAVKMLLRSTTKLARKFITTNNLLLCNITDLCRFSKEKNKNSMVLGGICKDLEGKEHEFNDLRTRQKDQEKSLLREINVLEPVEDMDTFMNSLLKWSDQNYPSLKDLYQQLTKDLAHTLSFHRAK